MDISIYSNLRIEIKPYDLTSTIIHKNLVHYILRSYSKLFIKIVGLIVMVVITSYTLKRLICGAFVCIFIYLPQTDN